MAISVQDNELVVRCGGHTTYEDAHRYICSLLSLLSSVTEHDLMMVDNVREVCNLIEDLLPSEEEFYEMGRATKAATK